MAYQKIHEYDNLKAITTYIDGILVDGSNILYTMVQEGDFGFTKLMTLHTRLYRTPLLLNKQISRLCFKVNLGEK